MSGLRIIVALLLLLVYLRVRPGWRRSGPFLPDGFVLGLLFYAIGSSWLLVFEPAANLEIVATMAWTALAAGATGAIIYCVFATRLYDGTYLQFLQDSQAGPLERAAIYTGVAVSSLVSVYFIYIIARSDVIAALLGVGPIATEFNLLKARVAIASGSETYLAPGYFKQFRDILLPILLSSILIMDRGKMKTIAFWCVALLTLTAMLVSGQRLVVVIFLLTLALALHYSRRVQSPGIGLHRSRIALVPVAMVITVYGLLTVLLGRIRDDATAVSTTLQVATNFFDRVFLAAPRENAITYPVWSDMAPTWGTSWWNDLQGVLPGVDEKLSNILHMATGGSAAGDSPLGLAPDVWLAWGWPGLLIAPLVFGIAVGLLDLALALRRSPILAGSRFYLFLILPVCYSPFIFILYGGAVAASLLILVIALRPLTTAKSRMAKFAPSRPPGPA